MSSIVKFKYVPLLMMCFGMLTDAKIKDKNYKVAFVPKTMLTSGQRLCYPLVKDYV